LAVLTIVFPWSGVISCFCAWPKVAAQKNRMPVAKAEVLLEIMLSSWHLNPA
jgi:hypothetical protein